MAIDSSNICTAIRTFTKEGYSIEVTDDNDGVGIITWDNPGASGLPSYSDIKTKAAELSNDNELNALRRTRDFLISQSDWRGNQDVTMSDEWKTYRQALRDITSTVTDNDVRLAMAIDEHHSGWPTKP